MKEHSKRNVQEVIDVLQRYVDNREDVGFDMAAGCCQWLKDVLNSEK